MTNRLLQLIRSDHPIQRVASDLSKRCADRAHRRLNFGGSARFEDRQSGTETLIIIVGGYRPKLWPYTFPRLALFLPPDADVCLTSPGLDPLEVREMAERNGWSYLSTPDNRIARAKNHTIRRHPNAQWIVMLDEDIFLTDGMISQLRDGFERVREEARFEPGFVAPLLNVNGHSYTVLLRLLELEEAYRARFGELKSACMGIPAHADPEAARWLWRNTTPLDATAERLRKLPFAYSAIPHRFSIGAMGIERSFWQEMGGFRAALLEGHIGRHERVLCEYCTNTSRPGVLVHTAFAGHFAFYTQIESMERMLAERPEVFALPDQVTERYPVKQSLAEPGAR